MSSKPRSYTVGTTTTAAGAVSTRTGRTPALLGTWVQHPQPVATMGPVQHHARQNITDFRLWNSFYDGNSEGITTATIGRQRCVPVFMSDQGYVSTLFATRQLPTMYYQPPQTQIIDLTLETRSRDRRVVKRRLAFAKNSYPPFPSTVPTTTLDYHQEPGPAINGPAGHTRSEIAGFNRMENRDGAFHPDMNAIRQGTGNRKNAPKVAETTPPLLPCGKVDATANSFSRSIRGRNGLAFADLEEDGAIDAFQDYGCRVVGSNYIDPACRDTNRNENSTAVVSVTTELNNFQGMDQEESFTGTDYCNGGNDHNYAQFDDTEHTGIDTPLVPPAFQEVLTSLVKAFENAERRISDLKFGVKNTSPRNRKYKSPPNLSVNDEFYDACLNGNATIPPAAANSAFEAREEQSPIISLEEYDCTNNESVVTNNVQEEVTDSTNSAESSSPPDSDCYFDNYGETMHGLSPSTGYQTHEEEPYPDVRYSVSSENAAAAVGGRSSARARAMRKRENRQGSSRRRKKARSKNTASHVAERITETETWLEHESNAGSKGELYTIEEFKQMWIAAETDIGFSTEEIEEGNLVRGANTKMRAQDSTDQLKAQYGRMLPNAMEIIFHDVLYLTRDDIYVDIGHGIGNTLLQAAHTVGCECRGIEVVEERNFLAEIFSENLKCQRKIHLERDDRLTTVPDVKYRHGRLEDPAHRDFIIGLDSDAMNAIGCVKVLVNNFNGVFADRCAKSNQVYYLDHYLSGLFASMKPDSVFVTLHPLLDMPLPYSVAVENRRKHNLPSDSNASFYEMEKFNIGKAKDCVSWSQNGGNVNNLIIYRYTRLKQEGETAVFLCANPKCDNARKCIPIEATKEIDCEMPQGLPEKRVVINHCSCKMEGKTLRKRRNVSYNDDFRVFL